LSRFTREPESRLSTRNIIVAALAISLLLIFIQPTAAQTNPTPNTLFIFDSINPPSVQAISKSIEAYGGRADHIFPPNSAIGYLPAQNETSFLSLHGGIRVEHGIVDVASVRQAGSSAELAATMWNMTFQNQIQPEVSVKTESVRRFPPNDARIAPDRAARGTLQREAVLAAPTPGFNDTSEFLIGSVVV